MSEFQPTSNASPDPAPSSPPPILQTGGAEPTRPGNRPPPPRHGGQSGGRSNQEPRRSGSSWGWILCVLVLGGLLMLSMAGNLALSLGTRSPFGTSTGKHSHTADHLHEVVLEEKESDDKIVVIELEGVITSGSIDGAGYTQVQWVRDQLERAKEDKDVKAVLLKVDSPGGEVLASDEIYQLLEEFQKEPDGKPIVVSMGNLAASGGYYISAPCQWIVANELTITGSIGVIMHGYNYRGLMEKVGVRPQVFKSGRFKDMLSGEKLPGEELPEERQMVQDMVNETFARFKKVVGDGRAFSAKRNADGGEAGRPLAANWESLADGRIFSGRTAYENGFVDELGNFKTAVQRAEKIAGISDADLVAYQLPFRFGGLLKFLGEASDGGRGIRVDLGLPTLPKLHAGRLYFLSPTHIPIH